jgi:hypothetical protein
MYRRIHSDICNVPKFLLTDIKLHIKFTKAKPSFFLMNHAAESKTVFKFLDAKLFVKLLGQTPGSTLPTKKTLKADLARYKVMGVELKLSRSLQSPNHYRSIKLLMGIYRNFSCSP